MENILNRLKKECRKRKHITSLLPEQFLDACIQCEQQAWIISFSENEIIYSNHVVDHVPILIEGKYASIQQAFLGKERLQTLVKRKELVYHGSYRSLLLLESILWLCKEYELKNEPA
ncbi:hypothetical protein J2S13_001538 [Oikeobacillus pervagus]|uniref:SCP2 domain-containing protein n=1 Tax=Oikeobacillus pervagus TaxID=1325931 RepID=A0AAJ1T3B0_9BACI|nr:hypothetical protein [Oikeobacillus pervagus]MDQ0215139.1 hypothetical protein [Oikeobacillus pervagus]